MAACSSSVHLGDTSVPPALRELVPTGQLRVRSMAVPGPPLDLTSVSSIVLMVDGWRVPELALDRATAERLRTFVRDGGRLVLLGYASALVSDLGIEEERPEPEPFRWGFDARTVIGEARLGIRVVTGNCPELFEGLAAAAAGEFTHYLTGGAPCCVPMCAWTIGEPQQGQVFARLATELDGKALRSGPPVMVRWEVGRGEVLALGVQPALDHVDDVVRGNARRLVQNLLTAESASGGAEVVLLQLPMAVVPDRAMPKASFVHREVPMYPLLAHWGWGASVGVTGEPDASRTVDEIVSDVMTPSWTAGADLLELAACDSDHGSPLQWSDYDAMRRPDGYRGGAYGGAFGAAAFAAVADEAHGRGMLVQAFLDAPPFGERTNERLAALRFFAREVADVRRLGAGAVDAFGLRRWFHDGAGYSQAMVQDLNPACYLYRTGELAPQIAASMRALDAEDGAVRGLATVGLSQRWRDGFPADLFPMGVLDARVERALPSVAGSTRGGGSYGDWIVTQANDFVRDRAGQGAALWWRTHDVEALGRLGLDYVQGISLDPVRAAVATQFAATGSNGYRAAAARLLERSPDRFGAEVAAGAAVHMLQNNWFRLLGSGGGLLFDPTGQARFRPGEAVVISPRFLRTKIFGARLMVSSIEAVDIDLLANGSGTEGAYGRTAIVGFAAGQSRTVPSILAFDEQPRWPQRVQVEVELPTGYYELELGARAVRGRGILVTSLDGTVVDCQPFLTGVRAETLTIPLHIAAAGLRTLELAVAEGGALAIDRARILRRGDVAAEGSVKIAAGYLAEIGERSASSYHDDRVDLRTIGDFPGFLLRAHCVRAERNLRVERALHLPGYDDLAASLDDAGRMRRPFVLRAGDRALPDIVVVPLQLARYDHFRFENGELTFHGQSEAGSECRIGFWLVPNGLGDSLYLHAAPLFRAIDQPLALELGDRGTGTLVSDLEVPWTRVVHVQSRARTPYLVRENGWWTWRGAQPAPGGGDWLRVYQLPGDTVEIVGGPAILARTRPGPGSLHVMALGSVEATRVKVRVLQPNRLVQPSVVMAADFAEVSVDGVPWAWFDGRTVFLPDRKGDYTIETRTHGGEPGPHIARTRAPLERCEYDAQKRELILVCDGDPTRPVELPFTAIVRGGVPSRVTNGEIVGEETLPHENAQARARAEAGGVLIRFRAGVTKVHYEN